jgi:preprotein translocase subunit YajC
VNPSALLLIIVAFAFLYFVLVRPQKRRQATQAQMLGGLKEGDEIVTAGGIYGEITGFQDDDLLVRIAPELEVRVARRAVGGVISRTDESETPDEPEVAEEPAETEPENLGDPHPSETTET